MQEKHFGDTLLDYLLGTLHVSFSDEETDRILKIAEKGRDLKTDEVLSEKMGNNRFVRD